MSEKKESITEKVRKINPKKSKSVKENANKENITLNGCFAIESHIKHYLFYA